jgi:lipopolysaccharide biosynthesis glycosyltransferase
MNTRALATMVIGNRHKNIFELTKNSIIEYAKKINSDLVIYDELGYVVVDYNSSNIKNNWFSSKTNPIEHSEIEALDFLLHAYNEDWQNNAAKKLRVVELLEKYERVLFIDCDILIQKDSPDLFEIVPFDKVGMFNEGTFFTNYKEDFMQDWCEKFGLDYSKWDGAYYNSGVILFSRGHENLFYPPKFMYKDMFYDQTHLNANIMEFDIPMQNLPYQFNRVFFIDGVVPDSRYDSFFIHYAGSWHLLEEGHDENPEYLLKVISYDLDVLNGKIKKPRFEEMNRADVDRWWEI